MKHLIRLLFLLALVSCSGKTNDVDLTAGINNLQDLAGKKVAVFSGSIQDLLLADLEPEPELMRMYSPAEIIAAVGAGKADYAVIDTLAVIGSHADERGMKYLFSSDEVAGDIAFAMRLDDDGLASEINAYLAKIKSDGTLDTILNKWTLGDVENVVMPVIDMDPEGELLRVGTINDFPFSFIQNGEYAGYEIELINRFAAETGRRVEWQMIDFTGIIASIVTGKIDIGACAMTVTEERAKQVRFSDSYYFCKSTCFYHDANYKVPKKPFFTRIKESFYNNLVAEDRWEIVLEGLWETIVISFFSILIGTLFGALLCWMRLSKRKGIVGFTKVFVEIVRGIPVLVLLMIMFYVVFSAGSVSARWVAVLAFAINFGAYVSEMFRTGIESVDKGQTEAGLAMGFTKLKTFLFFVLPQAAKKIIPVFKGEAVSLIKNTSVVGYIAIIDLTKSSEIIRARTFDAFFPLIIISIIYFILAWLLGKCLDCLAKTIA